jgi:hypothetical protein
MSDCNKTDEATAITPNSALKRRFARIPAAKALVTAAGGPRAIETFPVNSPVHVHPASTPYLPAARTWLSSCSGVESVKRPITRDSQLSHDAPPEKILTMSE